jgi:hypothetical protein
LTKFYKRFQPANYNYEHRYYHYWHSWM